LQSLWRQQRRRAAGQQAQPERARARQVTGTHAASQFVDRLIMVPGRIPLRSALEIRGGDGRGHG